MPENIRLGISSCLLGNPVRYNGGHKLDRCLRDELGKYVDWVPVCPEVECGLGVPREAMHLTGDPAAPRLVTSRTGVDHTERMLSWASRRLDELEAEGLCGFVFKSRSPSSGMRGVKVYTKAGMPSKTGPGLFAGAFMERFPLLPVEDEDRLKDPILRENFIERIFVMHRWKAYLKTGGSMKGLADFHTGHELLIMAHSPKALKALGLLAANAEGAPPGEVHDAYLKTLMATLSLKATLAKNTNVLKHIMGHFKNQLTADEKQEMKQVIGEYRQGLVPLIVSVTLVNHYARKFGDPYLEKQVYLHPYASELKLRNHAAPSNLLRNRQTRARHAP
ncbi:MAG: DUF523 and DUF1722 domain-containing protein [Deltaproteobacteria bacterium]|nr:DUF523 and DUF1722 domain-containing protein [Deltaproteobacteria bacterium]